MTDQDAPQYEVLARKYRPRRFEDLLGHEAMVRTLRNAFESGRIAHAYILTGVRGVGKTTTARIMARALNYKSDTIDAPTVDMPVEGLHCRAIAESRHPDVIEMDAASRTGVGDIRELIEGVRYAPVEGRYKVYIIDEVHMLSVNAFNALLKTLEEPPPHVKFIFATTEIRKVPITVLSRCQRFDLRRFDASTLAKHLGEIAQKEGAAIEEDALIALATAAEGSVRDGLSLLDQAIIQGTNGEPITGGAVREMLGLVDRTQTWDLFTAIVKGDTAAGLDLFRSQYNSGADPSAILRDLSDIVHLITRTIAAGPTAAAHGPAGDADKERAQALAESLSVPALTRAWSLLMTALNETLSAPDPAAAAEIGLIRLGYTASLPTPEDALRLLKAEPQPQDATSQPASSLPMTSPHTMPASSAGVGATTAMVAHATVPQAHPTPATATVAQPDQAQMTAADLASLIRQHRDLPLVADVEGKAIIVRLEPGRIELALLPTAPRDLPGRLTQSLREWTSDPWIVTVVPAPEGAKTLRQDREEMIRQTDIVKKTLSLFPGAEIKAIRPLGGGHQPPSRDE